MNVGFRELKDNIVDIRNKQSVRRPFFMSASIPVPNGGGLARATLVCDQDADILILGLNGSIVAPADVHGRRLPTQATHYPMTAPAGVAGVGFAERGLVMRILETDSKHHELTDPTFYMDAKNLIQPGYRIGGFSRPYPWKWYLMRDSKLTFEFINNDMATGEAPVFHFITLVLTCKKYEPFTK